MRISNNMMVYNFLSSLNKSQNKMNDLQQQMSDGKIIHKPSDDPIRAYRSLKFGVDVATNDQYTQNAKDGVQWLNQTDTAIQSISGIMINAKELTVQADDANPANGMQALGESIDGLIGQALTVANTQIGDRYIFAGQQDKVAGGPFVQKTITVGGATRQIVAYQGDLNKISMSIQAGPSNPKRDSVSVTGDQVFGPLSTITDDSGVTYKVAGLFNDLETIKDQIMNGTPARSNPAGGTATVSGPVATGQDTKIRIDTVNVTGQVTAASYWDTATSAWVATAAFAPGSPSNVPLPGGGFLNIDSSPGNNANDTYSFTTDPASLTGTTPSTTWLSNTALGLIDKNHDRVLLADTEVGARMASYESAQSMMASFAATIADNQSANDDLDVAKATIDFKNNENVYNAALAIGAKIIPPSLVDFLR